MVIGENPVVLCKYDLDGRIRVVFKNMSITTAVPPATQEETDALVANEKIDMPTCDINFMAYVVPYLQAGKVVEPLYTAEELYQQELNQFKAERAVMRSTPIKVSTSAGIIPFDADIISRETVVFALQAWDKVILDDDLIQKGLILNDGKTVKLGWITSENTLVFLAKADLQAAIEAFAIRYSRLVTGYLGSKFLCANKYGVTLPEGLIPKAIQDDPDAGLKSV